jgi:hypothetical protein
MTCCTGGWGEVGEIRGGAVNERGCLYWGRAKGRGGHVRGRPAGLVRLCRYSTLHRQAMPLHRCTALRSGFQYPLADRGGYACLW